MSGPQHVVLIAAFFPPWGGGGVLRMAKLARYLPDHGWRVTVLTSDEPAPDLRDDALAGELPAGVVVHRIRGPLNALGRPIGAAASAYRAGSAGRLVGLAKAASRALFIPDRWIGWAGRVGALPLSDLDDPAVIVSSGPPHSAHLGARRLAARAGIPFIADLRDDWAGNPLHRSPAPWHGPLDARFEARTLAAAGAVTVVSEAAAAALRRRRPALAGRVLAIPNGVDLDDLDGLPPRAARAPGAPVRYLYAGSLRSPQLIGAFPAAFGRMSDPQGPPPTLTMLGNVDPVHRRALGDAIPEGRLRFLDPVEHRAALAAMADADVLVVFTGGGGAAGGATMTGKLYEYLALRRPILLVGPPGPAAELVRSAGAGAVATPVDPASVATALGATLASAREPSFRGIDDARLAAFDRRAQAGRWAELLRATVADHAD